MNASSQARKKTRIMSPKAKKTLAAARSRPYARTIVPSTRTAVSQRALAIAQLERRHVAGIVVRVASPALDAEGPCDIR